MQESICNNCQFNVVFYDARDSMKRVLQVHQRWNILLLQRRHCATPRGERPDIFGAVKSRDFAALQQHASQLFSTHWKDEYAVPVVCVVVVFATHYWLSARSRRIDRMCEAAADRCNKDLDNLKDQVNTLRKKWESDMKDRETAVREVLQQNSELTKSIDQMTTALKQCAPRTFA